MNRMKITKCNIYGGMKMKEFKYVITDNEGIHARPAGELVKLAKSFESSVMIEKEGKKADLILLNIDQPHITPTQNLVNTIVDAANGHDVIDSIINGKLVMKNREVLTLDEERIRFEATQHMNEIIKRAY